MAFLRFLSRTLAGAALFACLPSASAAAAQCTDAAQPCLDEDLRLRAFDLQLFTPPASVGTTFLIERPEPLRHLSFVVGVTANGATDTFVRSGTSTSGATVQDSLVAGAIQGELVAALGLFEQLEIGLAIPLVLGSAVTPSGPSDVSLSGNRPDLFASTPERSWQIGASDLRLSAKVPLVRSRDFGLAVRVGLDLPPCVAGSCGSMPWFSSTRYWSLVPSLVATGTVGPLRIAGELGYRMRQRRQVGDFYQDDEIRTALGVTWTVLPELAVIAEGQWRIGLGSVLAGNDFNWTESPLEVDGGVRILPSDTFTLEAGVGTGVLAGYGAPTFRGFVTGRMRFDTTSCTGGPEDYDGFQDGDFCLDADNDGDGVEDVADRCVNDAEDADGFQDADGCPELDNDGDRISDDRDACPVLTEDDDAHQDEDGCPEPDNDEDGVPDGRDACRMDPEDLDQFQDEDGCPEPGPRAIPVTVSDTRILIGETVYFEFDTDIIRPVSMPLLDQVAAVIGTLDGQLRIRVEGHTDDLGNEPYNVDLSFRRARAVVEYLASRGVARDRLEYRGYGSAHPVAPNDSPQGRSLNRRVEFTILRPGEPVASESSGRRPRR